jgi:hypothetical protein
LFGIEVGEGESGASTTGGSNMAGWLSSSFQTVEIMSLKLEEHECWIKMQRRDTGIERMCGEKADKV